MSVQGLVKAVVRGGEVAKCRRTAVYLRGRVRAVGARRDGLEVVMGGAGSALGAGMLVVVVGCGVALGDAGGAAAEMARGVVFLDANGNGTRDAGEVGIGGVLVSNGVDVVPTDGDGRYEIVVGDDTVVFVIKPRGYRTAMDERNLWRGFYVHRPEGSPDGEFRYEGVAPTGPLPASVDFGLVESAEGDRFSFLALGDTQPYTMQQMAWLARDTFSEIIGNDGWGASFGVSLGDLVGDDLSLFGPLNGLQSRVGVPWYNIFGNHDMNFMSPNDEDSDETFTRVYGPATFAFQHGPAHFIALDNVIWQGFDGLSESGFPRTGNYRGGLREDQIRFVENYLRHVPREALVVLLMHIPLDGEGVHVVPERRRLFEVLSGHANTFSLSGHTHFNEHWFFGSEDGYTAGTEHHHWNAGAASGSWFNGWPDERGIPHTTMRCGAPNGYSIVTVDGNRYSVRYKASSRPMEYQMEVVVPTDVSAAEASGGEVVANVFAGSERSRVEMRVNGGGWVAMERSARVCPVYAATVEREKAAPRLPRQRGLPEPRVSSHIWVGVLPDGLAAGTHAVEVRHTDMFGQVDAMAVVMRLE